MREAALLIGKATRILVLSGAGLSKASGIPTYRDTGGLWVTGDNLKYSHIDAYRDDPASFSAFWAVRRTEIATARPNAAHLALKMLQQHCAETLLVTQNIDGLLQQAGCGGVLELHGNLLSSRCGKCGLPDQGSLAGICLSCFSPMRPDVVMFGEALPEEALFLAEMGASRCDVILVVGTTAAVYPAAELPAIAVRYGAKLIVLDVEPPLLARAADVVLRGKAEQLLPELVDSLVRPISTQT
jgi:NAD-dependent deacetylase